MLENLFKKKELSLVGAGNATSKALLLARVAALKDSSPPLFFLLAEERKTARRIAENLSFFSATGAEILQLPREEDLEKARRARARLARQLYSSSWEKPAILALTAGDLETPLPSAAALEKNSVSLAAGASFSFAEIFELLLAAGFEPTEMAFVEPGSFLRRGNLLDLFPSVATNPLRLEFDGERLAGIFEFDLASGETLAEKKEVSFSAEQPKEDSKIVDFLGADAIVVLDEGAEGEEVKKFLAAAKAREVPRLSFSSFGEENAAEALRFSEVLRSSSLGDFVSDLKKKKDAGWRIVVATHRPQELARVFEEKKIVFKQGERFEN